MKKLFDTIVNGDPATSVALIFLLVAAACWVVDLVRDTFRPRRGDK